MANREHIVRLKRTNQKYRMRNEWHAGLVSHERTFGLLPGHVKHILITEKTLSTIERAQLRLARVRGR